MSKTLDQTLSSKKFSEAEIVLLFEGLAKDLATCHQQKLPHGDLSPATVVLTHEGAHFSSIEREKGGGNINSAVLSSFSSKTHEIYTDEQKARDISLLREIIEYARTGGGITPPRPVPRWFEEVLATLQSDATKASANLHAGISAVRRNYHRAQGLIDEHSPTISNLRRSTTTSMRIAPAAVPSSFESIARVITVLLLVVLVGFARALLPFQNIPIDGIAISQLQSDFDTYWWPYFTFYALAGALPVACLTAIRKPPIMIALAWVTAAAMLCAVSYAAYFVNSEIIMAKRFPSTDPYISVTSARMTLEQLMMLAVFAPGGNNYHMHLQLGSWAMRQDKGGFQVTALYYYLFFLPYCTLSLALIWGQAKGLLQWMTYAGTTVVLAALTTIVVRTFGVYFGSTLVADGLFSLYLDYFCLAGALLTIGFVAFFATQPLEKL